MNNREAHKILPVSPRKRWAYAMLYLGYVPLVIWQSLINREDYQGTQAAIATSPPGVFWIVTAVIAIAPIVVVALAIIFSRRSYRCRD